KIIVKSTEFSRNTKIVIELPLILNIGSVNNAYSLGLSAGHMLLSYFTTRFPIYKHQKVFPIRYVQKISKIQTF
ncbi:hypothetical protein, partial [Tenacibaculum finnmarkense]|uniref:hypothetical protein n=1 Tax=Tenacibaculum finnmarkense TaxID=2781243 RepID=UPI001EFC0383